jgi:hypothetical protein
MNLKTVDVSKPTANLFEFFNTYIIDYAVGDAMPCQTYWPPDQKSSDPAKPVYRSVPYPYPRQSACRVIVGLSRLDYATGANVRLNLNVGENSSTGFGVDAGPIIGRDNTQCYGLMFSWADLNPSVNTYCYPCEIIIKEAKDAAFTNGTLERDAGLPSWFKEANNSLKPMGQICWIQGLDAKSTPTTDVSVALKSPGVVTARASADTKIDFLKLGCLFWVVEEQIPIFSWNFQTPKDALTHVEKINFGGKFKKTPKAFWALTGMNVNTTIHLHINTELKSLNKDSAELLVNTWDNSKFTQLGFVFLAFPDADNFKQS